MFKKEIKIWILYLTIVLGLIFSFAFGVLVRQELVGYVKMGPVSKAALFIADIPSSMRKNLKKLTYETIPLDKQIWSTSAGTNLAERFFHGDQINKENVNRLTALWEYNSGSISLNNTVQTTPIFTGDQLITVSVQGHLIALNPRNGKENWKVKFDKPVGRRGLTYVEDRGNDLGGIYVASGDFVLHIDQKDGSKIKTFDSGVSLMQPFVFDDSLLVATVTAGVKSFDVRTGLKSGRHD